MVKRDLDLPSYHDLSGNLHIELRWILVRGNKLEFSHSWLGLCVHDVRGTKHGSILDFQWPVLTDDKDGELSSTIRCSDATRAQIYSRDLEIEVVLAQS